jgi:hypothetical protein
MIIHLAKSLSEHVMLKTFGRILEKLNFSNSGMIGCMLQTTSTVLPKKKDGRR